MSTWLASLLLTAAASAQDQGWDAMRELRCSGARVTVTVQVTDTSGLPDRLLYRDAAAQETRCTAELGPPAAADQHRAALGAQCAADGLDERLCADLADDIVDRMIALAESPPLDWIAFQRLDDGAQGSRAQFGLAYTDGTIESWRGFLTDEDLFRTRRRVSRIAPTEDTNLECLERAERVARGRMDGQTRVEVREEVGWRCTDDAGDLDIDVRFTYQNRAVEEA